ncbi:hypothetical protein NCAS_0A11820 [Naumovozyma castellii]|uniref:Complex 1 LYR protein domain-containing protein n=1 Tax=Naumovozyma castellii TaxID=27288 RepID=G0V8E2_NAUCA|nr:hypothetical protein NCAS_0A11820 [Naumovozyma castellii CBS 4309]CCC67740.1 hypothetical protein NCAS_0A11820 [Naumovozyma castellii CBS 4309]
MVARLRGIQQDVIHFYRQCIRAAMKKPVETRPHFIDYIHSEFGKHKNLQRKDFTTIEYLLRVGNKKLKMYSQPELKDIH